MIPKPKPFEKTCCPRISGPEDYFQGNPQNTCKKEHIRPAHQFRKHFRRGGTPPHPPEQFGQWESFRHDRKIFQGPYLGENRENQQSHSLEAKSMTKD